MSSIWNIISSSSRGFSSILKNIELKNIATRCLSSPKFLRISFSLCSGIRKLPLFISISLLIAPRILLDKNDFIVLLTSSDSSSFFCLILSTAKIKPLLPHCIKSIISKTPDAIWAVENFLAMFSTSGKNLIIIWSRDKFS